MKGRGRTWKAAAVTVLAAWMLCSSFRITGRATCAACRLDRTGWGFLGFRWATYEESECSRWYAVNVEPAHEHAWAKGGFCRRFGIPGIYGGHACSVGEPITGLGKSFQLRVYQRFGDPLEAKRLFVRLGQRDGESQRLMQGLSEWMESGGPESWDEWWPMHREE